MMIYTLRDFLCATSLLETRASPVMNTNEQPGIGVGLASIDRRAATSSSIPVAPVVISTTNSDIVVIANSNDTLVERFLPWTANKKRTMTSRRLDSCPDPEDPNFIRSTCDHTSGSLSAKSYKVTCNYRHYLAINYRAINDVVTPGTCEDNEFRVQNDNTPEGSGVAYGVGHDNVVYLVGPGASPAPSSRQVTVNVGTDTALNPAGDTLNAIMLTPDESEVLQADSISVSALAKNTINGQDSFRAQVGGTATCTNCASLQLPKVPANTARLVWNAVFHGITGGALFVPSVVAPTT